MLTDPLPYVTQLKFRSHGPAVEASKRAVYRFINNGDKWDGFVKQPEVVRRTFGPFFLLDVRIVQGTLSIPTSGRIDKVTLDSLVAAGSFDQKARALWLEQFGPKPSPLIEPYQGFDSLIRELWPAYTIGRGFDFLDGPVNGRPTASGTYANKPGDHGFWPSYAFDLDIIQHTGWENLKARHFFELCAPRPEVHYVILGDRISSKERGLHAYTQGGHDNHVHVSGLH